MPRRRERHEPRGGDSEGGSVESGWRWEFAPAAARQFNKLGAMVQQRIVRELDLLVAGSRVDVLKLEGADEFRLRVGSYRVIYVVNKAEKTFLVSKVADRKEAYR